MNRLNAWGRDIADPLRSLQGELNRLYEHYRHGADAGASAENRADGAEPPTWTPPVDVYETPDEIGVCVDLPGVDPAQTELTVTGRVLTISGVKVPNPVEKGQGHSLERAFGPFRREVDLPSDVDLDAIKAETIHGVLHVRLPKAQAAKPRTIPIRTT